MAHCVRSAGVLLALVVLGGCTGDGSTQADSDPSGTTTSPAASPTTATAPAPIPTVEPGVGGSAVPDACTLIAADELERLLWDVDQGTGEPQAGTPDRTLCFYSSSTITAVEIAANYEASRALIESDPSRTVTDVEGVGTGAYFDDLGGAAQFVAKGERFFVAVTFLYESKDAAVEAGKQITAMMLAAAEQAP